MPLNVIIRKCNMIFYTDKNGKIRCFEPSNEQTLKYNEKKLKRSIDEEKQQSPIIVNVVKKRNS